MAHEYQHQLKEPINLAAEPRQAPYGPDSEFIARMRQGVPRKRVTELQGALGLSQSHLATLLHVSARTLQRYPEEHRLAPDLSERVLLLGSLYRHGEFVFGTKERFQKWLNTDIQSLNFDKPVNQLDTIAGIHSVDQLLGRMEHGIY